MTFLLHSVDSFFFVVLALENMFVRIVIFLGLILTIDCTETIIEKLRLKLEQSQTIENDLVLPFLCKIFPTQEFIKQADDEDFLSDLLYELGFGVLGVKPNSWGDKLRNNSKKSASCFAALHSTATTEVVKSTLASSRRILSRCCQSQKEL